MFRPLTLVAFAAFLLFYNCSFAQDELKTALDTDSKKDAKILIVQSLDGKNQEIHIMPDYSNHKLRMSCLKDTITDFDFWGVPVETTILNKQFVEIKYAVRGGSNIALRNVIILCVYGDKLCDAMHFRSLATWESGGEDENYSAKIISLSGTIKEGFKLILVIHDHVKSKSDPQTNFDYNDRSILHFDHKKHVFFSIKEYVFDCYAVTSNPKTGKGHKQKIKGDFPIALLGKEQYYFINNDWYQSAPNELGKFSTMSK
ncbi:MAG TPA: hypothetical protein VG367_11210 [Mucilaginibacter sp.]|jgi:hypothetical protein|nr:hypothetical protein [Mucilaginibacter sp.]